MILAPRRRRAEEDSGAEEESKPVLSHGFGKNSDKVISSALLFYLSNL